MTLEFLKIVAGIWVTLWKEFHWKNRWLYLKTIFSNLFSFLYLQLETSGLDMHPNLGHAHVIWNLIQGIKVSMLEKIHFSLHSVTLHIHFQVPITIKKVCTSVIRQKNIEYKTVISGLYCECSTYYWITCIFCISFNPMCSSYLQGNLWLFT